MLGARAQGVLLVLALLLAWELAAQTGAVNPNFLPPVTRVLTAGIVSFASGEMPGHILTTLRSYVQGFLLAAVVGVVLGLLMGLFSPIRGTLATTVELLRPMPSVAIIPIAIVLFGLDDPMKRFVIMYAALWPVLINTLYGVLSVDPLLIDTARTFRLGRPATAWKVIVPAASPYIATGLRVSSGIALILAVTAEMVASRNGLGYFVMDAQLSYRIPDMYVGIVTIGLLGYALHRAFVMVEERVMAWHRGLTAREGA